MQPILPRRPRSSFLFAALLSAAAFPLFAQSGSLARSVPIDENQRTTLPGHLSMRAAAYPDQGRVPDDTPQEHVLMMLRRTPQQEQSLQTFIGRQYDSGSQDFHHWLTPQEFGEQYGPSTEAIQTVTGWLAQHGFRVNNVAAGGLFVDFSGTTGQIARAFGTEIHSYGGHLANNAEPTIPTALAPLVSGFRALNNFHPQPHAHQPRVARFDQKTRQWSKTGSAADAHLTAAANALYLTGPQDYARIYGVDQVWQEPVNAKPLAPKLVGTGQTIGVVGETEIAAADIQSFRDQFGTTALGPHGSVQMENPPSTVCAAPDPSANETESYLDAEWSGAMAPDATVDFVACGRQGVTSGADLAAAYIINDPAHVKKISVLSTSYGDCEAMPQSEANQFYVSLWQQAAVEGITVVVAAGDSGGEGCNGNYEYASHGLSVINEASTPWNVAAGGTDFSDVFSGTTGLFWSQANGANERSAQSYIPETTWNDSCASPLVTARFGKGFSTAYGPNGFCTYAENQPVPAGQFFPLYANAAAGGGGLSTVSARPVWQSGVPGIPAQSGRAVPDISMFASSAGAWSQALILCDSAVVNMAPGTGCNFSDAGDVFANYDGGTSFVAPAFAGIMALINQKSGDRQGQANYILYPLAREQYVGFSSPLQPSLANCAAYLGPLALRSCYFHDVSATPYLAGLKTGQPFLFGTTSVPCVGSASAAGTYTDRSSQPASNSENCYGYEITVGGSNGSLTTTPNYYGVLSTASNGPSPAFSATPGYDLATGLGSPNVYALVNAPQWSRGGLGTTVSLALDRGNITEAQPVTLLATVTDEGNMPVLGGTVTFYSGNTVLGTVTQQCSLRGAFGLQLYASALGGEGTYPNIFAAYSGGSQKCRARTATYYGAQSASSSIGVTRGTAHATTTVEAPIHR